MILTNLPQTLSIAPMLDWTDRHERYFLRLISKHILLYTEMITTGALLYGEQKRFLQFNAEEHPVALQLGGSEPDALRQCAIMGEDWGYDEINLNVGCPSDRVLSGRFGACLMAEPELVAEGVAAMSDAVKVPVTVKTRIGIDHQDSYAQLYHFIQSVAGAGCKIFIIHARKAWLKGLSPKQNREVPPLRYEVVHQLKQDFPDLQFVLNGGILSLEAAQAHLPALDGVMIGREAYQNPYMLANADKLFYGDAHPIPSRHEIIEALIPYVEKMQAEDVYLKHISRHILGLFHGVPGARRFRRYISEHAHLAGADAEVLRQALAQVKVL
ncbi:tRNA dihydrouridine(20/20a) synthase DusA [Candidatus Venteria ishoeyi]|uniref:tRNA-dihydrouridine(20/20a) synthase n=1 Tax=Candidatus Venteria ishoeyi TaxID=1899563 RepID=A0A1H6FBV7_9GAMM|nr:putative tRNA-dihydrouridine synthase [Candidatus Venteria ishoeyi]